MRTVALIEGAGITVVWTGGSGVPGWVLAVVMRPVALIEGAGIAVVRTGRSGRLFRIGGAVGASARAGLGDIALTRCRATLCSSMTSRMLARRIYAVALIERAWVVIRRRAGAWRFDGARRGAAVAVIQVSIVALLARLADAVAATGAQGDKDVGGVIEVVIGEV
jgi:hypothetical protein